MYLWWCVRVIVRSVYIVDSERCTLGHMFLLFHISRRCQAKIIIWRISRPWWAEIIFMIAWAIVDFDLHVWIENKWAVVGRNYYILKCIFGHVSIYKGSAVKILRIWRWLWWSISLKEYSCYLEFMKTGTVTTKL